MVKTQVVHVMVWLCVCFLMISVTFMYRLCAPDGQIRGFSMKALYRPCICHVYILFCWHPTTLSDHNVPGGISDMRQTSLENNSELSLGKLYHVNCHRHTIILAKKKVWVTYGPFYCGICSASSSENVDLCAFASMYLLAWCSSHQRLNILLQKFCRV